ncbi:MAG TPA: helix-turn-helix domain-containing protein [Longimicrobium sp.]|jgi:AraC-like DNA-binding protein
MQSEIPTLYLLHDAPEVEAALRRNLGPTCRLRVVADWTTLREALKRCAPNSVVVVNPYLAATPPGALSEQLFRMLAQCPSSPVVVAFEVIPDRISDLRCLHQWGVADALDLGEELTSSGILHRFAAVRHHRIRVVLKRALPRSLPMRARALITAAAEVVSDGGQTTDLAERLQLTERTLLRWCLKSGLPQPRRIFVWMRLLLAADMLCEGNRRSVAAVARACGYASDASLRHAFKAVVKTTPAEVKEKGAHATIALPFRDELAKARAQARAAARSPKSYLN